MAGLNSLLLLLTTLAPFNEQPNFTEIPFDAPKYPEIHDTIYNDVKVRQSEACLPDEVYQECGTACPKDCNNWQLEISCIHDCVKGCFCKEGMVRGPNGRCIWPTECPSTSSEMPRCPALERYSYCDANCQRNCSNWNDEMLKCPYICMSGCVCEEGLIRGPDGKCIKPKECEEEHPVIPNKCPDKEHFTYCGPLSYCQRNCSNWDKDVIPCPSVCVPGCVCDEGLIRGPDRRCISPSECEVTTTTESDTYHSDACPPNEVYMECGTACPSDCSNWQDNRPCIDRCMRGCFCKEGMVRGPDGRCIWPRQCQSTSAGLQNLCSANEHYSHCEAYWKCQRNCFNWDQEAIPCPEICVRGCVCDEGFVRDTDGRCIRSSECEEETTLATDFLRIEECPSNEIYEECGTACPKDCSNWQDEETPCTDECVRGCFCKEGMVRGPDGRCIWPRQCPSTSPDTYRYQSRECPPNEEYLACGTACPKDCSNWKDDDRACIQKCVKGCFCKEGMVRGPNGRCIWPRQCPSKSSGFPSLPKLCPLNKHYSICGAYSKCQRNCSNWEEKTINCPLVCVPGCICDEGLVEGPNGQCIRPSECAAATVVAPNMYHSEECPPNEEYQECGTACPNDCTNWHHEDRSCATKCVKGCFCKKGMVRGPNGRCIWPRQCPSIISAFPSLPKLCPLNEHYSICSAYWKCQRNCSNWEQKSIPCFPLCVPGCICDEGLVRGPDGRCIRPTECEATTTPVPGTNQPEVCPPNEEFSECGTACPKDCTNWQDEERPCTQACVIGCFCKEGMVRGPDGRCIWPRQCPSTFSDLPSLPKLCSEKEKYSICGAYSKCQRNCSNWNQETITCPVICVPGCVCEEGLVRDSDGECIRPSECEATTLAPNMIQNDECPWNEEYLECGTACPKDCTNWQDEDIPCTQRCVSGCFCKEGMVRGPDGRCMWPKQCPSKFSDNQQFHFDTCPKNEEYLECGTACPSDCTNWQEEDRPCTYQCVSGCFCKEGMVRGPNGRCIWPRQCPAMTSASDKTCPANEEYLTCGTACPDNCDNWNDNDRMCTEQCVPGCFCKSGWVRGPEGKCIRPRQCPPAKSEPPMNCSIHERYEECGSACPRNCTFIDNSTIPCSKECVRGCFCKGSRVRGPDGRCIYPLECPTKRPSWPFNRCGKDEKYKICSSVCPDDCDNYQDILRPCKLICSPGCECKKGLVRGPDGRCIKTEECREKTPDDCTEREKYDTCGTACEDNCRTFNLPIKPPCDKRCRVGCFCQPGFVRGPDGDCIWPFDCPAN